ncbi:MAG: hypothetical protein ACR2HX_10050 [Pyrinomonadaceae bacterium]
MIRRLLSITFLLALSIASVFAQQRPDFSGTWKLNVAWSDFGILGGPNSRTDVIIHKGRSLSNSITADSVQGRQEFKMNYTTDGKQAVNKMGPLEIKSTLKWVGNSLVISSRFIVNNADISSEATWTLSPDGKTLTTSTRFKGSLGDSSQKLVFEKQ